MRTFLAFLENLRPRQWTKNLILFAGVIFAQRVGYHDALLRALAGCLIFCLASGAIYVLNDVADAALDREHPYKKNRPIPSGRLPAATAAWLAVALAVFCLGAAALLGTTFALATGAFLLLNLLYTHVLKKVAILDVTGIAVSFVIRAVASVEVLRPVSPGIQLSNWLILCTFFLSLFLGFAKRRSELMKVRPTTGGTRPVLADYTETLLNTLIGITFTLTLMGYSLYTVWPGTVAHFGTSRLVFTLPFVFYGMGRYLYLVYRGGRGGRPHEILLNDPTIQLAVLGWVSVVFLLIDLRR
ncbi:MAG: decaprenyl-phosphate phosphoribosyltransferase [Candidatus Krumholzibacteriia bacterium]